MAGRRTRHNAAPLPGMPPLEPVTGAVPLRVHLDLPPERLVWEVTNLLKAARGIVPLWPFSSTDAREGDILLIRVREPPTSGAPGAAVPRSPARAVALVPDASDRSLLDAARAGAWAAVPAPDLADRLSRTVRRVAEGECPLLEAAATRPRVAAAIISDMRSASDAPDPNAPLSPLSGRETDMLRLVADGVTNRVIAERLNLSEQTVKNYLSTIFAKTGTRGRAQAAALAVRRGWLPPE